MNERILELAKQCASEDHLAMYSWNYSKFAQLIVRECAEAVENSIWHLPRGYKAVDQAEFLKKHFGVQE